MVKYCWVSFFHNILYSNAPELLEEYWDLKYSTTKMSQTSSSSSSRRKVSPPTRTSAHNVGKSRLGKREKKNQCFPRLLSSTTIHKSNKATLHSTPGPSCQGHQSQQRKTYFIDFEVDYDSQIAIPNQKDDEKEGEDEDEDDNDDSDVEPNPSKTSQDWERDVVNICQIDLNEKNKLVVFLEWWMSH